MSSDTPPIRSSEFARFDDIRVGDEVTIRKHVEAVDVDSFASLSGDDNPLHIDDSFARRAHFKARVAHGMLSAAYISALVGTRLPGPGALWTQQSFDFLAPIYVGDVVDFGLRVRHKSGSTRSLVVEVWGQKHDDQFVLKGQGTIMILEEPAKQDEKQHDAARTAELEGKTALVTGASRGIGSAIARHLGAGGASVVVNYRADEAAAKATAEAIAAAGGEAATIQADIANPDDVERLTQQAADRFGRPVCILVNNAASPLDVQPWDELRWNDIERSLNTQVQGAFRCGHAVSPGMIDEGWGRIVNIGSTVTWGAPPARWTAYTVAKHALLALTRSMAVELGPKGVSVNSVSPGMTPTDLIEDIPQRARKVLAMQTPLRRLASPEDTARIVLMLCTAAGDYLSGADIPVAGGGVM